MTMVGAQMTKIAFFRHSTVKPLITNTSEEFIKCSLDNFSMSFILFYVNFSICENKWIPMNMREQFWRAPYNHLIKKLNVCNIPLLESEEYNIWWILSMYLLLRVSLCTFVMNFEKNFCFYPKPSTVREMKGDKNV